MLVFFLPRYTWRASGRSLAPRQSGQVSLPKKYLVPSPLQPVQAPYGELNEKSRGSTSGKEKPSYGHINFADMRRSLPSESSSRIRPSDSARALSMASPRRSVLPLESASNSLINISSIKTSISCFFVFVRMICSRSLYNLPSTLTLS